AFQNCGQKLANEENLSSSSTTATPQMAPNGEKAYLVEDMVMSISDYDALRTPNPIRIQSALIGGLQKWPGGNVKIQLANVKLVSYGRIWAEDTFAGLASAEELSALRSGITTACQRWGAVANISCEISPVVLDRSVTTDANGAPYSRPQPEGVVVAYVIPRGASICGTTAAGCAAIGGPGTGSGGRALRFPYFAVREHLLADIGIFMHEFGHTLGFVHEHTRTDRDQYLDVNPLAFHPGGGASLFEGNNEQSPFDFSSIMQYPLQSPDWDNWKNNVAGSYLAIKRQYMAQHMKEVVSGGYFMRHTHGFLPAAVPSILDVQSATEVYGMPLVQRASCSLAGKVIPHGAHITAYVSNTIDPTIKFCRSESRVCNNGVLSGSATSMSCDVGGGAPPPPMNQVPTGNFEDATTSILKGWALDPDSLADQVDVFFYRDAAKDAGGVFLAQTSTNVLRPDVNMVKGATGNHGFNFSSASLAGLAGRRVFVYVRDRQTGSDVLLAEKTVSGPEPVAAMCAAGSENVLSSPNNVGAVRTCVATWSATSPSAARINSTVTNGGSHSAICSSTGAWTSVQSSCPPLANQVTPPPSATMCAAGNEVRWVIQDISGLKNRNANQPPASFCRGLTSSQPTRAMSYPVQTTTTVGFMVSGAAQAVCNANGTWSVTDAQGASCGVDNIGAATAAGKRFTLRLNLNASNPSLLVVGVRS
ncbi:MAG: M12 family metallopeptidase, partial [Bdellovibrionales bacterium]|nr:M12 family metallopeptidase [Bdellovibrionales bacterium]